MYKGKRRRLRKKDLTEQVTFEFHTDVFFGKYKIWLQGTKRRFFSKKSVGKLNIQGSHGDDLSLMINMDLFRKDGTRIFDAKPFILLPVVKGRKYYWVDEEQV